MRSAIYALLVVLMTSATQAQTKDQAKDKAIWLVEQCQPLASLRGDPLEGFVNSTAADSTKMMYCVGFLDGLRRSTVPIDCSS